MAEVARSAASWLTSADSESTPFEQVLGHRPELLQSYREFYGALWDRRLLPTSILKLTRLRLAQPHGCDAELWDSSGELGCQRRADRRTLGRTNSNAFSPVEQVSLGHAELILW